MTDRHGANPGCVLVGEYVDDAGQHGPPGTDPILAGSAVEIQRPHLIFNYLDVWARDAEAREFTILLRDQRVVSVRGHTLKTETGYYGILRRDADGDSLIAVFPVPEVIGIFSGEIRAPGQS
jgi:hypothetical protein